MRLTIIILFKLGIYICEMNLQRLATFLLIGSLAMPLQSQDLSDLNTEKDQFKYIPPGAPFLYTAVTIEGMGNKTFTIFGYDKNHDGRVEEDCEMFIDINDDFIPDMPLKDFMEWYYAEKAKKAFSEASA